MALLNLKERLLATRVPDWAVALRVFIRADLDGTIFACSFCMRLAQVMSATRIVSCKSDVQHLVHSMKKCPRILIWNMFLKPCDSRSHNENVRMTSCLRSFLDARATKVAYDSHKQNRSVKTGPIRYHIFLSRSSYTLVNSAHLKTASIWMTFC